MRLQLQFQTITGTVERQSAHFYRVTVTEADLRAGVIITCTSAGNDKFKVSEEDVKRVSSWKRVL